MTFIRGFSDDTIMAMLGPNPKQECFRLTAYYLTDLAFQASRAEPLAWGEFMERYTTIYPRGQPDLLDDPVTVYVNSLRATGAASDAATTRRTSTAQPRDPVRECNVCMASASRSSELEPAPRRCATDAQRGHELMSLWKPNVSLTKSWPSFTTSWGKTQSPATGSTHTSGAGAAP
jgi:hypothetical protein